MTLFVSSHTSRHNVQSRAYSFMLQRMLSHSSDEITVDSLQKVQEKVLLLDAREPEEFKVSHIKNAIPVGFSQFDKIAVSELDSKKPIVVYCSVGYRSEKIAEKLYTFGINNVFNLYGGIFEWKNQGNEVVDEEGPTNRIHAYNRAWSIWLNNGEKVYE